MNDLKMMVRTERRNNKWSQFLVLAALLLALAAGLLVAGTADAADQLLGSISISASGSGDQTFSWPIPDGAVVTSSVQQDVVILNYAKASVSQVGNEMVITVTLGGPCKDDPRRLCDGRYSANWYFYGTYESANEPPTADAGGPYLVAINAAIGLNGTGTDPDGDTLTYAWSATGGTLDDSAMADPQYMAGGTAGIYDVTVTVTDPSGESDSATAMVVVFDPNGGFVTGGGWIMSAAGACQLDDACAAAAGKATFGFVSRYKKGATVPDGNTEFQFQAGNLNFHSSAYDWLVVNQDGTNAQFKGSGTINGAGSYKFMIWAGDGDPDQFRIRIWTENGDEETDVYDNGFNQPLDGGSIVIHD